MDFDFKNTICINKDTGERIGKLKKIIPIISHSEPANSTEFNSVRNMCPTKIRYKLIFKDGFEMIIRIGQLEFINLSLISSLKFRTLSRRILLVKGLNDG